MLLFAASACDSKPVRPPLPDDANAAVAALRQGNHGPLQGSLDRIFVHAWPAAEPARKKPIAVALDRDRLRVDRQDGHVEILTRRSAWRCVPDQPPRALTADERQALQQFGALLGAVYLAPLYGAQRVERRGPQVFAITAADGSTWRLEIDLTHQRPKSLSGPPGEVRFDAFLTTAVSQLPTRVQLGAYGEMRLEVLGTDALFEDYLFQDPTQPLVPSSAPRVLRNKGEARPSQPVLETQAAKLVLVIDDPGDWTKRADAIVSAGSTLGDQGQIGEGLPFLFDDGGKPRIGLPFVPDDSAGSPPFVARPGQDVRPRPRHTAIVVYRDRAPFETSAAQLAAAVVEFGKRAGHRANGPLRTLPYLAWEDGGPSAERLARMGVRVELPIEEPR